MPEWLLDMRAFLVWVTTVGAGLAAYWVTNRVPWGRWEGTATDGDLAIAKRLCAWAVAGMIAILAWLMQVAMLYAPMPVDWRATIETLFGLVAVAGFAAQMTHTVRDLPRKGEHKVAEALDTVYNAGYEIRSAQR